MYRVRFVRSNKGRKVSSIRVLPIYYIGLATRAECTNAVHVCQGRHKSIYPRMVVYIRDSDPTRSLMNDGWRKETTLLQDIFFLLPFSRFFVFLRITFDRLSRFYSPLSFFPAISAIIISMLAKIFLP